MTKILKSKLGKFLRTCFIFMIVTCWIFSGWPRIWQNPPIPPKIQEAQAAVPTFVAVSAIGSSTA
ncbi:MAG: hypothetical protein Q8N73_00600, partial [bacterium]|nr:hypothetical protein [bacterium]